MAVSDKIKALMKLTNKSASTLADTLDLSSTQALYNKLNRDSFTADDLIKIAYATNSELCFVTKDKQKISFTPSDVKSDMRFTLVNIQRIPALYVKFVEQFPDISPDYIFYPHSDIDLRHELLYYDKQHNILFPIKVFAEIINQKFSLTTPLTDLNTFITSSLNSPITPELYKK